MSLPIVFHPEVDNDLFEARTFYELRQAGLGDRFVLAVGVVQTGVAATPLMHQTIWRTVRRALVLKFPYGIFYRVLADRVERCWLFTTFGAIRKDGNRGHNWVWKTVATSS